jgi:hypothetical protein
VRPAWLLGRAGYPTETATSASDLRSTVPAELVTQLGGDGDRVLEIDAGL